MDRLKPKSNRYLKSWRTKNGKKTPRVCLSCGRTFESARPKSLHRICDGCRSRRQEMVNKRGYGMDDYMPSYYLAVGQARWYDT